MTNIDYTDVLHKRENNAESEAHLKENKFHFTGQCAVVLSLLMKGVVLTSRSAMLQHNIADVHRRIGELKVALQSSNAKIKIEDRWVKSEKGRGHKEWFISTTVTKPVKAPPKKKLGDLNQATLFEIKPEIIVDGKILPDGAELPTCPEAVQVNWSKINPGMGSND